MATGLRVFKTLIKYNNNSEENDEKEKEPINIELAEQKSSSWNDENAICFKWSDVKEENEEDIALANFNESLQKQTDEIFFLKNSNWMMTAVSYMIKRKIKKIFLEVISNSKIFNIKFYLMKLLTNKIFQNLQID